MALAPIVIIPARMASRRLPGKPLADIGGEPMIVHVLRRALAARVGPVFVACAEPEIVRAVDQAGGNAVLTDPSHRSGSDRIAEALQIIDPERRYDTVVNLQGDLPTLSPEAIRSVLDLLRDQAVDIATLAAVIADTDELNAPQVVKVAAAFQSESQSARALYFSRSVIPGGTGPHYHHIGIYAYRRTALERFIALPEGMLERRENLEQLRALEAGMRVDIALVDTLPLGVDTQADLARAREILGVSH